MSTLQVDRIEPYQSASVTIVGLDIDTTALNNFTASQEALNGTFATTGSNTFDGNQVVSGDITATKLTLTGGTGNDLIVTGSVFSSAGLLTNGSVQAGASTVKSYLASSNIATIDNSTADEIGFTYDSVGWGVSGWTGPSFYLNDPTDSYPAVIGFQNKASWTDGTISILKPLVVSGSVAVTGDINATRLILSGGAGNDLIVTGSATFTSAVTSNGNILSSNAGITSGINASAGGFFEVTDSSGNNIGIGLNPSAYGTTGWTGPAIWLNDPSDNYPNVIGFQNKSTWTDGRITVLKPLVVSGSVEITQIMTLTPQDPLPAGAVGQVAVSGSNLYFYTDQWREVAFV
jgi:cytoskeletal protein CcmA (bactofilin family)